VVYPLKSWLAVFQTSIPLLRIEYVRISEGYDQRIGFEALKIPR